ncbi:hypothetical protein PROFUN_05865 [Planoprotostelium fungivorum]|uniref:Uncharacterized protein n=1 Tax=Planoprotostelium fungivorum TaxID=1890364 RepID=A0A2P6NKN3_9EUKA|nr:hypothetical protein PROFUN_05865 [Planoprotostelium fungivorum]
MSFLANLQRGLNFSLGRAHVQPTPAPFVPSREYAAAKAAKGAQKGGGGKRKAREPRKKWDIYALTPGVKAVRPTTEELPAWFNTMCDDYINNTKRELTHQDGKIFYRKPRKMAIKENNRRKQAGELQ